jgi:hypothetical protein
MADIYKVGVDLAMTTNMVGMLGAIGGRIGEVISKLDKAKQATLGLKLAAAGAISAFLGFETLKGLGDLVGAGNLVAQQQSNMLDAGIAYRDVIKETGVAWQATVTAAGSSVEQNMSNLMLLKAVLGNLGEANNSLVAYSRGETLFDSKGMDGKTLMEEIIRAGESGGRLVDPKTGAFSDAMTNKWIQLMESTIIAMKGNFDPADMMLAAKRASSIFTAMSTQGVVNMVPVMNNLHGDLTATALIRLNNDLKYGRNISKGTILAEEKYGLLDPTKVKEIARGVYDFLPGAYKNTSQLTTDPQGYIISTIYPLLQSIMKTDHVDLGTALSDLKLHGPDTNLIQEIINLYKQGNQTKDVASVNASNKVDHYQNAVDTSLDFNEKALAAALHSLKESFIGSDTIVNDIIPMIHGLTDSIDYLGAVIRKHQSIVKWMLAFTAALAAFAVVFGTIIAVVGVIMTVVAVVGGSTVAIIAAAVAGIIALIAAIVLITVYWPEVKAYVLKFLTWWNTICKEIFDFLKTSAQSFWKWFITFWNNSWASLKTVVSSLWPKVETALSNFATNLVNFFTALPGKILSALTGSLNQKPPILNPGDNSGPTIFRGYHHNTAYVMPPMRQQQPIQNVIYLDGHQLQTSVNTRNGHNQARPASGPTNPMNRGGFSPYPVVSL